MLQIARDVHAGLIDHSTGKIFYGWYIVGGGVGLLVLTQGLITQAFGAYVVLLRAEFGWSATMLSLGFAFSRIESGVLGPIQGWLIDRYGPRAVMRVGMVLYGLGLMAFSQLNSPLMFFVTFAAIAIGSNLGGFIALQVAVVNWFERRRTTALALLSIGLSLAGLTAPVVIFALDAFGWRAVSFGSGVLVLVVGLPLAGMVRHRPEEMGYVQDGVPSAAVAEALRAKPFARALDFTAREAMRTPAFWFLSLGHAAGVLVVGAMTVHLVPHLTDLGYSLGESGMIVALIPISMLIGRVIAITFGDRGDKRMIVTIAMAGHVVAPLLVAYAQNFWMVLAFAVILGASWATRGPLVQAMRADYFGRASFGTIMGFSSLVMMGGSIAGPMIAGVSADATGEYKLGFTVIALVAALGCVFFLLSVKPAPPPRLHRLEEEGVAVTE